MARLVVDDGKSLETSLPSLIPPSSRCVYTACYCEENVWKMCDYVRTTAETELKNCFAVFISNKDKRIPLWYQRASKREDRLVVWDYHVLLVYSQERDSWQRGRDSWVYDLDTELSFPCPLDTYLSQAVGQDTQLMPEFRRMFRVVKAEDYLKVFASDRSHMKKEDGSWLAEPPVYPCISTPACQNNLSDFISMEESTGLGSVMTAARFAQTFS